MKFYSNPASTDKLAQIHKSNLESIKKKVVTIGKLPYKNEIRIKYFSKQNIKNYISKIFKEDYSKQLAEKEYQTLRLMGFINRNQSLDIWKIKKRLFTSNINCFYNKKQKELIVLNRFREVDFLNSLLLVYGLRQAVQDQYNNIGNILNSRSLSDLDDRRLAISAAFKGDATYIMVLFAKLDADILSSSPTADALMSFLPVTPSNQINREPEVLKNQLYMPYISGLRFISTVYKKKKWKGVNRILQHPPESSEQILHPEKYFKREAPLKISILYHPPGYPLFHSGVLGEYYLSALLKQNQEYANKDYAWGWGGDLFKIYKNNTSYFLTWESEWDKPIYCSHFFSDFKRFLEKKFNINFKNGKVKGIEFIAGQSKGQEDYFFLMKKENKMFYTRTDNRNQMNTFIFGGNYD